MPFSEAAAGLRNVRTPKFWSLFLSVLNAPFISALLQHHLGMMLSHTVHGGEEERGECWRMMIGCTKCERNNSFAECFGRRGVYKTLSRMISFLMATERSVDVQSGRSKRRLADRLCVIKGSLTVRKKKTASILQRTPPATSVTCWPRNIAIIVPQYSPAYPTTTSWSAIHRKICIYTCRV